MKRIRKTLATTVPVQSYGGLQLSLENLESIRLELMTQAVEMRLFHDAAVLSTSKTSRLKSSSEPTASMSCGSSSTQTKRDGRSTKRSGILRVLPEGSRSL
jgi:hypothetical protein